MVSGDAVSNEASSVDSIKSGFDSVIEGIPNWSGSSYENFNNQCSDFSSYFDAVKGQMDSFSQACSKYAEYTDLKSQLEQAKADLAAENAKDEKEKNASRISELKTKITDLEEKIKNAKNEIKELLQSISSVSLSASGGSYSVSVNTDFDSGKGSSSINTKTDNGSSKTTTKTYDEGAGSYSGGYNGGGSYDSGYNGGGSYNSGYSGPSTSSSAVGSAVGMTKTANTGSDNKTTSTTSTSGKKVNVGDLDMNNYPRGDSLEDGKERAVLVAKYLMKNGGFTAEQAAAMAGVYLDENNCDPGEVMEAEKNGQGAAGTGGNGYGAGIASWTFEESKQQSLSDAGFDPNTPIENLTMQQQCDVIIAESQKSNKQYYDALKRCDTLEDASATAVVITGGVGFSNNWDTHPTPAEAKALSDFYGSANDASFGASEYHWNLDQRRLEYAKEIYERL